MPLISRRDACRMAAALPLAGAWCLADSAPDSFQVYTEGPRLFLRPARLRLLLRERERRSLRWEQFETLGTAGAAFPEAGWADALRYRLAEDEGAGRRAVAWAGSASDIRQIALVADWCSALLSGAGKAAIFGKLAGAVAGDAPLTLAGARDRTLAAVALAEEQPAISEKALRQVFGEFWMANFIPALKSGSRRLLNFEAYALLELMHAFRDNLNFDLRDTLPRWFRDYPASHIAAHYPAPWPAAENEFRVPADPDIQKNGPDVMKATLSRAAELAMVAFDSNAAETQLLQGFLMNDRFAMRGALGIVYELLWANPYQPGISYYHVPLAIHDAAGGQLFVRSSWEDDASWIGLFGGQLQVWREGAVTVIDPKLAHAPIDLEEGTVVFAKESPKFRLSGRKPGEDGVALDDAFVLGLEPNRGYHVEVDRMEMREEISDSAGTVFLAGMPAGAVGRFSPAPKA